MNANAALTDVEEEAVDSAAGNGAANPQPASAPTPSGNGAPPDWAYPLLRAFRDRLARRHGEARRAAAGQGPGQGLLAWGRHYLPAHFSRPPSNLHRWLGRQLDEMAAVRGRKLNVLAPRGAAKSTLASLVFPLRAAVEGRERYIWIVSDTRHQAAAHLENLKAELLDNPQLAAGYPGAAGRGPTWRAGMIVLRNGVTVEALGTGQRVRGRRRRAARPTLIVCDDLQNDSHIVSARGRERSWNWFQGALMKAGTPTTNIVNLATALHRDAVAMVLHRTPGWVSRVFRAIERWPDEMGLWEQWEAIYCSPDNTAAEAEARRFYDQHRAAMDAGARVLWPEEEDLLTLMKMRAEGGHAAFEREKQNSPIQPELCEWPEAYFDKRLWFDQWPAHLEIRTMALDPSKGSNARRGDYSALVSLGIDRQGVLYVEADLARRTTSQMVADAAAAYARFRPDAFGVESNQFQDLLAGEFEAEFARQGLLGVRPWLIDNRVNKLVRIRRLGPYLAARRLRMKSDSPGTALLVEQLKDFPQGDHDDGPDALEMALRLAVEMSGGAREDGLGQRLQVGA